MYDRAMRKRVLALVDQGHSPSSVNRQTGISRSAIRARQTRLQPLPNVSRETDCFRCGPEPALAPRPVGGVRKRYEYPRYFFTNTSGDIVRICGETLDRLGVEWRAVRRPTGAYNVSVARRASVALMDAHIGPKH